MKERTRLSIAILLCFSVFFTSCAKNEAANNTPENPLGSTATATETGATGKYVQQDVTPPQLVDGSIAELRQLPDGRVLVIGSFEGQIQQAYVTQDGSVWEEAFPLSGASVLNNYPNHKTRCTIDDEGVWWIALSTESEQDNHLFRVQDGTAQDVAVSLFATQSAGFVTELYVGNDNTILMETMVNQQIEWTVFDCASGKETNSFKSASFYPTFISYRNGKIYALNSENNSLHIFDALSGKEDAVHQVSISAENHFLVGDISADESLSYVDTMGIHKMALGGNFLQNVAEGRAYAFSDSTFRLGSLLAASDNSYWLSGMAQMKTKLYRYVFDENASINSAQSLYIWTMEDNTLLKLAVSIFAQANPDCEVVVETGRAAESTGQTDEDIVRALNAQILSGDMPDVLILDDLPLQGMIKQGLLTDLSGIISEDEYYKNIINCYQTDGKTYAYPALFWPVGMLQRGDSSSNNIASMTSMKQMEGLLTNPEEIYFGGYSHLFNTMYAANSHLIFPNGNSLNETALKDFLQVSKAAVDAQGLANQELCPTFGTDGIYSQPAVMALDPSLGKFSSGDKQSVTTAASVFYEYASTLIFGYSDSGNQPQLVPVPGNAFVPKCVAGVPQGAKNEQAGKMFIKTLLECQTLENTSYTYLPGFLVRAGVEKQHLMNTYEKSLIDAKSDPNVPPFPDVQKLDIEVLINKLENASITDTVLRGKLYEQVNLLFNGSIGVEEAVSSVKRNTELYFAERQ